MKNIILCDIDGTVANNDHRQHFLEGKKDWDGFFDKLDEDEPIRPIINKVIENNKILFSNFDLPNVKELFDGPQWKFQAVEQTTNISGKNTGRKKMKEILIYNY
jgi:hypothetical protein